MTVAQHPGSERKFWRNMSVTKVILTTDDYSATPLQLIACLTGYTIFVQQVTFAVNVEHASEAKVEDEASTPVIVAEISAPSTEGPFEWPFGEDGFQCTEGKDLNYRNSGAGMGLTVYVQAYMKPTATLVAKAAGFAAADYGTL